MVEAAIMCASTAPSGAHKQPWTFVLIGDREVKRQIRMAAEDEEKVNYLDGRLPPHWREDLEPLGTDWQKQQIPPRIPKVSAVCGRPKIPFTLRPRTNA